MKLSQRLKIGITILLIIAFFLVLNLSDFSKKIKNFFYLISAPIQKILWKAGGNLDNFFTMIFEIKNLKKENEALKLRIQELLSEKAAIIGLKKENKFLREALEVGLEKEFKLQVTEVIGKDISQDFILTNKGSKDGILEGSPVITQQKALIGKISEIYDDFSKVMLISHKESSFDTEVQERSVEGIVKGKGNFKLFLELIPKEKEIKEGDLLVTTSLAGIYPKGLLVGQIKEVQKSEIEPFQTAEIEPAFKIGEIEHFFIITNY